MENLVEGKSRIPVFRLCSRPEEQWVDDTSPCQNNSTVTCAHLEISVVDTNLHDMMLSGKPIASQVAQVNNQ